MQTEQEKPLAETLQEGQEVAIAEGYTILNYTPGKVKKITPSGQIVVTFSDNLEMRFNKEGREIGGSSLRSKWLYPMTEEIRLNILRKQLNTYHWNKPTDEQIKQIAAILGWQEGK